jgi:hypothetical protein
MTENYTEWQTTSLAGVKDDFPLGSIAILVAPYPIDSGLFSEGKTVDRFVKRSAGGGRWVSYPGSDVYYENIDTLRLDAEVKEIILPAGSEPEQEPPNIWWGGIYGAEPTPDAPKDPFHPLAGDAEEFADLGSPLLEGTEQPAPAPLQALGVDNKVLVVGALALGAYLLFR